MNPMSLENPLRLLMWIITPIVVVANIATMNVFCAQDRHCSAEYGERHLEIMFADESHPWPRAKRFPYKTEAMITPCH